MAKQLKPMKTFKCNFGRGLSCEVQVTDEPPAKGAHVLKVEWSGERSARVIRPYIAWMNTVNTTLANEWGIKLMHVFQTAPTRAEVWVYEPGKPPKKVSNNTQWP